MPLSPSDPDLGNLLESEFLDLPEMAAAYQNNPAVEEAFATLNIRAHAVLFAFYRSSLKQVNEVYAGRRPVPGSLLGDGATATSVSVIARKGDDGTSEFKFTSGAAFTDEARIALDDSENLSIEAWDGAAWQHNYRQNDGGTTLVVGGFATTQTYGNAVGATALAFQTGSGALSLQTEGGNIQVGTTAFLRTVNIATGAARQTVNFGSLNSDSSMRIDCGTGTLRIAVSAAIRAIDFATGNAVQTLRIATGSAANIVTMGTLSGAASLTLLAGTGNLALGTAGQLLLDSAGVLELNTTGAALNIGNDAGTGNIGIGAAAGLIGLYAASAVVQAADMGVVTDSAGGTPALALVAVSGTGDDGDLNDNFSSIAVQLNKIRGMLSAAGGGLGVSA